jgi:hypothetical protein
MFVTKKRLDAALDLVSAYRKELDEAYHVIGILDQKVSKAKKTTTKKAVK